MSVRRIILEISRKRRGEFRRRVDFSGEYVGNGVSGRLSGNSYVNDRVEFVFIEECEVDETCDVKKQNFLFELRRNEFYERLFFVRNVVGSLFGAEVVLLAGKTSDSQHRDVGVCLRVGNEVARDIKLAERIRPLVPDSVVFEIFLGFFRVLFDIEFFKRRKKLHAGVFQSVVDLDRRSCHHISRTRSHTDGAVGMMSEKRDRRTLRERKDRTVVFEQYHTVCGGFSCKCNLCFSCHNLSPI